MNLTVRACSNSPAVSKLSLFESRNAVTVTEVVAVVEAEVANFNVMMFGDVELGVVAATTTEVAAATPPMTGVAMALPESIQTLLATALSILYLS